jgi:hypothetical protein
MDADKQVGFQMVVHIRKFIIADVKFQPIPQIFVASLHAGLNLLNIKRPAKFGCRTTFLSYRSEFFLSLRPDLSPYFLRTNGPNMRGLILIWLTLGLAVGLD